MSRRSLPESSFDPPSRTPPATAEAPADTGYGTAGPILIIGVFGLTLGTTYPLLTALLDQHGISSDVAGLNSAMTPLGMMLTAPLVIPLVRSVGPWRVMMGASTGVSAVLGLLALTDSLGWWFVLRFALGACTVCLFLLSETWISATAGARTRGRLLTVYASVLALGYSVGPAVLAMTYRSPDIAFGVPIVCPLLMLVPLYFTRYDLPDMTSGTTVPARVLRKMSPVLVAVLAVSVFESVTLQTLPAYGELAEWSPEAATLSLTVLLLGQVLFQYPMGWLADRLGVQHALILSLGVGAVGSLLLPWASAASAWYWPLLALWSGIAFAGHPLVLSLLGRDLTGSGLLLGNTVFAVVWGIGDLSGPSYVAAGTGWLGPTGLPWSLTALWLLALLIALTTIRRGSGGPERVG